jgi:hypothetical protein
MTVLHKSEKMKKVFIKPLILAFRQDKNLKDILVHKSIILCFLNRELFIYSRWDDFECKYRCLSVGFVYKSVFILPCSIIVKKSKNYNFSVEYRKLKRGYTKRSIDNELKKVDKLDRNNLLQYRTDKCKTDRVLFKKHRIMLLWTKISFKFLSCLNAKISGFMNTFFIFSDLCHTVIFFFMISRKTFNVKNILIVQRQMWFTLYFVNIVPDKFIYVGETGDTLYEIK